MILSSAYIAVIGKSVKNLSPLSIGLSFRDSRHHFGILGYEKAAGCQPDRATQA